MTHPAVRVVPAIRLLVLAAFLVVPESEALGQPRAATITGVVRDSGGLPVSGASVGIVGGGYRVLTDDAGTFRMAGIVAGPATIVTRRLGFRPQSLQVRLREGEVREVEIRLGLTAKALAEIRVTQAREIWESRLEGFNARSKLQVGHFVTRERIERANSANLTDLLREIPGVRVGGGARNEGRLVRVRGASCPPLVFVDGFPATAGEFDLDMVDVKSVEGIEVYEGSATIPPEFAGPRGLDHCGVIAVWSRPARPRRASDAAAAVTLAGVSGGGEYFTSDQVDARATLDSGSLEPQYPDSLYQARVSGRVVVEFVVDVTGEVDRTSVEILSSTDDLFSAAVREALGYAHFSAARRQGRKVRQLVQLPVAFGLEPAP